MACRPRSGRLRVALVGSQCSASACSRCNFGRRIIIALPLPQTVLELYDRFEEGVFGAVRPKHLPALGALTVLI